MGSDHLLSKHFYSRSSLQVAPDLLGCKLCFLEKGQVKKLTISETEAYEGEDDLASHASKGRNTRNDLMFGPAGYWYLYLCYGIHWMLNVVTGKNGHPSTVFIRGTEEISGPGRLTKEIQAGKPLSGKKISPQCGFWIEKKHSELRPIQRGPRIGVNYAGSKWAKKPYRFWFSKSMLLR